MFNFQAIVPHLPVLTRWDLPSLMCEIPPQFLSNLDKSLFLKTYIWADTAGFARNTFGVVGKGPGKQECVGIPVGAGIFQGEGFWGQGMLWAPVWDSPQL